MLLSTGKTDAGRLNKYARYEGFSHRHLQRSNSAVQYLKAHESMEVHKLAISKFPIVLPVSREPATNICASRSIGNCLETAVGVVA